MTCAAGLAKLWSRCLLTFSVRIIIRKIDQIHAAILGFLGWRCDNMLITCFRVVLQAKLLFAITSPMLAVVQADRDVGISMLVGSVCMLQSQSKRKKNCCLKTQGYTLLKEYLNKLFLVYYMHF